MTADDAAAQAVRAVPGDSPASHACRLAVAHVLALSPGLALNRWQQNLAACEFALLNARRPPRPELADVDVLRAVREAERRI